MPTVDTNAGIAQATDNDQKCFIDPRPRNTRLALETLIERLEFLYSAIVHDGGALAKDSVRDFNGQASNLEQQFVNCLSQLNRYLENKKVSLDSRSLKTTLLQLEHILQIVEKAGFMSRLPNQIRQIMASLR